MRDRDVVAAIVAGDPAGLAAGQTATITVEVDPSSPPPTFVNTLTVSPGGVSVTV